jgi:hypothetical protein
MRARFCVAESSALFVELPRVIVEGQVELSKPGVTLLR